MKTTTTKTATTKKTTTKSKTDVMNNESKTNVTMTATTFAKYNEIYDDLCKCVTKRQLVDVMNSYGLRTTTTPTTTPNTNDLYIQFNDKSRLLIGKKSLKLYTNDARKTEFDGLVFDRVNDGSYRTARATVIKTVENFTKIFTVFMNCTDNYLPVATNN
jgi:hypothetical protein